MITVQKFIILYPQIYRHLYRNLKKSYKKKIKYQIYHFTHLSKTYSKHPKLKIKIYSNSKYTQTQQIIMFNLQITVSEFQCRNRQSQLKEQEIIVFRFGSIKIQINIYQSPSGMIGGKKIILDISQNQLQQMFSTYAPALFIENPLCKCFCVLSFQRLKIQDNISGQEVYFYNDLEQIIFSANFSLILTQFKNPPLPKKQKIENHKTFQQFFLKPPLPQNTAGAKTMSSFLYGRQGNQKADKKVTTTKKVKSASVKAKVNPSHTGWSKKKQSHQQFRATYHAQDIVYQQENDTQDDNPPAMEFTNTQTSKKPITPLRNQLIDLNMTATEGIKFQTVYDNKNAFLKTNSKPSQTMAKQISDKLQSNHKNFQASKNNPKQSSDFAKINREQLRLKAKKQVQNYNGDKSIKIPVFKDGKYEFVQLADLSQQQISKYARKQRQIEQEERYKKQVEKQLQNQEKQNQFLKRQLQQKQKLITKKEQEARKQKLQLEKTKMTQFQQSLTYQQRQKQILPQKNPPNSKGASSDSDKDDYEDDSDYQKKHDNKQQKSDQQNNYESDFEEISMASAQKRSKISVNSHRKGQQSESYNDSYDQEFQSYSQSLLGSQPRLSMSQISQSLGISPKRR